MKYLQEQDTESNLIQRRINKLVKVQQISEEVFDKALIFQDKVKINFDREAKPNDLYEGDLVLKWDARYEDKGKHGKFDHLWKGPYQIAETQENNSYMLREENSDLLTGRPINGHILKHYLAQLGAHFPHLFVNIENILLFNFLSRYV